MAKKFAALERIEYDRSITAERDQEFWHHLKRSLLMALHEQGTLNTMQYRYAEEALSRRIAGAQKRLEGDRE